MYVLGLDPSLTNFGWALYDSAAVGLARVVGRGRFQTRADLCFIDRYIWLRQALTDLLGSMNQPFRVGVESPAFGESYSEGMYGLFLYVNEALRHARRDVVFLTPPAVKAHARLLLVEKGMRPEKWVMDKPDMVEAAKTHTGGKGKWNHNEADAYWVAVVASRFWGLFDGGLTEADLTPVEKAQFTAIHTFIRGKKAGVTEERGLIFKETDRFFLWSEI